MKKERATTYSLLAQIRNTGTLAKGPFVTIKRLYCPKNVALDGSWKRPVLNLVKN